MTTAYQGITIRFEKPVFDKLKKAAKRENRSFNNYIQTIIKNISEGVTMTHV
jgi:predicted HicB family RNase H-like nuclease